MLASTRMLRPQRRSFDASVLSFGTNSKYWLYVRVMNSCTCTYANAHIEIWICTRHRRGDNTIHPCATSIYNRPWRLLSLSLSRRIYVRVDSCSRHNPKPTSILPLLPVKNPPESGIVPAVRMDQSESGMCQGSPI